jgi:hypothetical protein
VLKIDRRGGRFYTPTRGIIHTDHNKFGELSKYQPKGNWGSSASIPHAFHEVVLDYDHQGLSRLLNDNSYFKKQLYRLRRLARKKNGRHCHAFIQIRKQKQPLTEEDIIILTELQLKSDVLDLISIPDPAPDVSSIAQSVNHIEKAFKSARKRALRYGVDEGLLMPYVDLNTDKQAMKAKIDRLLTESISSIGIRHRENSVGSSLVIEGIAEEASVWFHASGVKKHHRTNRVIPGIHIVPVHSFDSATRYKGPGYVPRKSGGPVFKDPGRQKVDMEEMKMRAAVQAASEKIEFFNPVALGYLTTPQYNKLYGKDLNCDCPLCKGKSLDDFVNYGLSNDTYDHKKYTAYQTVHESISSFNELEKSQETIRKSSYLDYLREKPIVNRYWGRIDEITAGTLRRSDW